MLSFYKTILLVALTFIVSACGFHLRGSLSLPEGVAPVYIGGPYANSPLGIEVRNLLNGNGVDVATTPSDANYSLLLVSQATKRRALTLGTGTTASEYQLSETITIELKDRQGKLIAGPRKLTERQILHNDPNQVLSSADEERLLREEMTRSLAVQVSRQLSRLNNKSTGSPP